jgi:diadenosine tetraphosphate (Ap4A) HIT family hydrolase
MACPFCSDDKIQTRVIYKDDLVMVFPTTIPITPGHVLVCTTRHVSVVDDLTNAELSALHSHIVKIKSALRKSFSAEGFNIAWNEGRLAGQSVGHLHIHVVPRTEGDSGVYEYEPRKFLYRPGERETSPDEELEKVATLLRGGLVSTSRMTQSDALSILKLGVRCFSPGNQSREE